MAVSVGGGTTTVTNDSDLVRFCFFSTADALCSSRVNFKPFNSYLFITGDAVAVISILNSTQGGGYFLGAMPYQVESL